MIYLLIGYMWLFVHRPFEIWPWLADLRIERIYMLVTLAYWMTQPKVWTRCRSHIPVTLLAITYLLSYVTTPYVIPKLIVEDWFKVFIFYVLVVTSVKSEHELRSLVLAYIGICTLYELHSLREYFNGRGEWRMGTWRMVGVDSSMSDPNAFGGSIIYGLTFLFPAFFLAKRPLQKALLGAIAVLGTGCVVLTGSRSAFVALALLVVVATLVSKYRWRLLAVMVLIPPIVWASLRPDLRDRYMTLLDSSRGPENANESAAYRTTSFWDGMHSFAENPIFGAGMDSYRVKTGLATHNLYNQAMGELGGLGLAVLVGFAWAFFADFGEARRLAKSSTDPDERFLCGVCAAGFLSCLTLFLLGWSGHNLTRYNWLWFGAFGGLAVSALRVRFAVRHSLEEEGIHLHSRPTSARRYNRKLWTR